MLYQLVSRVSRHDSYHLFYDSMSDETEENWRLEKRDSWRHDCDERRRGISFGFLNFFCWHFTAFSVFIPNYTLRRVRLGYSEIRIYCGIYSGYSAPGCRIAGMEIHVFRNENSSQTNAYSHYSNYSYSGLIPNERALRVVVTWVSKKTNWFCTTLLQDWHKKFAPLFHPIIMSKTKTNNDSPSRLHTFCSASRQLHVFFFQFSWVHFISCALCEWL